jgi:hypothetical protein
MVGLNEGCSYTYTPVNFHQTAKKQGVSNVILQITPQHSRDAFAPELCE